MIDHEPIEIHPAIRWMDEDIEPDWESVYEEGLYKKIIAEMKNPPVWKKKLDDPCFTLNKDIKRD